MDPREACDTAASKLLSGPKLRLAVLFGSTARGQARPDSDVDIAIVPEDPELDLAHEIALQAALEKALGRTVDLVRLDRAPPLLAFRIARDGVPILANPPTAWTRFRARAGIEHDELAPTLVAAARLYRKRILEEANRT